MAELGAALQMTGLVLPRQPLHLPRPTLTDLRRRAEAGYAFAVLAAPLVVAGYLQAHAAHERLGLPWPLAVAFTAAWEGAAGYVSILYHRTLVAGDSTVMLRLGMTGYALVSCGLLYWNLRAKGEPAYLAAAVGLLTLSGVFLWSRRARWTRREELRAAGKVDRQVVRFSLASWLLTPIETAGALRYAVKHRIEEPVTAIETYRASRRPAVSPAGTWYLWRDDPAVSPAAPVPLRVVPPSRSRSVPAGSGPSRRTVPPKASRTVPAASSRPSRTITSRTGTGTAYAGTLAQLRRKYPSTLPSVDEVFKIDGRSRSRAGRIRQRFAEERAAR